MKWKRALVLMAALAGLGGACAQSCQPKETASPRGEAARELVEGGAFLLDVRTPEEFGAGHLEGATNVPIQGLEERLEEIPRDRRVVVYCASGRRSAKATAILQAAGVEVFDLGAMENW